jgi:hypothetical protein
VAQTIVFVVCAGRPQKAMARPTLAWKTRRLVAQTIVFVVCVGRPQKTMARPTPA